MNVKNRTIFCNDNLYILRGLDTESVDLIYLDPPFNSKRNYSAPIGSEAAGAAFKDTWTLSDVDNAWHGEIAEREPALYQAIHASEVTHGKGMKSYLIMLAVRLLEMKRVLKPTGSIYLHCDPTASHYLKIIMDSVFGKNNFRNEIAWKRDAAGKGAKRISKQWSRVHDIIFYYSKTNEYQFDQVYTGLNEKQAAKYTYTEEGSGRKFKVVQLGDYSEKSIQEMEKGGLIHLSRTGKRYKKYYLDEAKSSVDSLWVDILGFGVRTRATERTGYPTQKPVALLDRIIKASSNRGDVVLDPFCGCATTCVAAERLQRQWIGIDISPKAIELVRTRLENEVGFFGEVIARDDIPHRSEKLPNYRTHKHTLYGEQEGLCKGCDEHFPFKNFTVDHITPRAKGGTDHEGNLQLLCNYCNSLKGTGTQAELIVKLQEQGIL